MDPPQRLFFGQKTASKTVHTACCDVTSSYSQRRLRTRNRNLLHRGIVVHDTWIYIAAQVQLLSQQNRNRSGDVQVNCDVIR